MSRTPIDLFVEALPAAAGQAFPEKSLLHWTVTVDDKPKPVPAGAQLLTVLLVAEPSKTEAAIQISMESTRLTCRRVERNSHSPHAVSAGARADGTSCAGEGMR